MSQDKNLIWENALEEIKLSVSTAVFQTLFANIQLSIQEDKISVISPNSYVNDMLKRRYLSLLKSSLEHQLKTSDFDITFSIQKTSQVQQDSGPLFSEKNIQGSQIDNNVSDQTDNNIEYDPRSGLHPKFTFENFVVGNSNNFAFAAAQGIVKNPGSVYNPFFLWGGVGVGKTHLMQAIGHELVKNNHRCKILYTTTEAFTNDLVNAIRNKDMTKFKQKYRNLDALLLDDIQFISGKQYVQEEIFHTFNNLHIANKQIILTSDRKPEEIQKIEDRLSSRFMGGLTVDIQAPDYEMRMAILNQKAEQVKLTLPQEAISFIAETIESNTRELEGFLIQISALAQTKESNLTLDDVKNFFGIKKESSKKRPHYRRVISIVSKAFGVKTSDICGKGRKKEIVVARHVAAYLLRKELDMPLQKVGKLLGDRDHTTIMHAEEKISRSFSTNQQLRHQIIQIQKSI